jgi:valyl-tRNA synthetase
MDKRYDARISEQAIQQKWAQENTYGVNQAPGRPLYTVDTPPPTVSGSLHIGHIFSYTQTDIIARYKRMSGYAVFYPFGFDDNGLPTERYVEKKRKIKGHQLPRSEFISICLQESELAAQSFKALWQRIGISADWRKTYSTISDRSRALSQASFIELYKKGYIYKKNEPALYCSTCRTSVAQAELDDQQMPSFFNTIVFKDAQNNDLLIGTTRPELLSSCVALLFNPHDSRYQHLAGQTARVPLFDVEVPIFADELVSIEKGTGLVMCCTFGDKTDIEWYKRFNLPYKQSIGTDGKWLPHTGFLAGLNAHEARELVLTKLKEHNLLLEQKPITHAVNVHERCKKEIEFIQLSQWFVKIIEYKQEFLKLADDIVWYPAFMKSRYVNWVENLGWDWCISRQRFYGVPFPVWHCVDCKAILVADVSSLPVDPLQTPFKGGCTQCGCATVVPDTDVMDTWNTSSITPYICADLYKHQDTINFENMNFVPMGMRPQAHDIIRTWAFYTIIKTYLHQGAAPWKDIVISGHVLSDAQEKISKSKGNVSLTPEKLLEQYSADIIRYWTASGRLGQDVSFSDNQLKIGQRLVTKLWNAFLFGQSHIEDKDFSHVPLTLGSINEWLLDSVSGCFKRYQHYLQEYEFSLALDQVEQFFWHDFCDNYIELIKNQLFNPDQYDAQTVYATQWTLYHVGLRLLQLYAPYIPHVTEAIYQEIYAKNGGKPSIHQTEFADAQTTYEFKESAESTCLLIDVVTRIRKIKSEHQLSIKVPCATLKVYVQSQAAIDQLKKQQQLLCGVVHAQVVEYEVGENQASTLQEVDGAWHAVIGL